MYIEFVIADNFLLTYLAGAAAVKLGHGRVKKRRIVAAATVGTGVALAYPFLPSILVLQLVVKITLWAILSMIMYLKTPRAAVCSLLFLGLTFTFGGASYALGLLLYENAQKASEFSLKCPLFLVLGCGAAVYGGVKFCVKRLRIARAREPYEYKTEIKIFGETVRFEAFLDTGNCVFDNVSGLPVVITDLKRFSDKLTGDAAVEFLKKSGKLRTMQVRTHAGSTVIYMIEPSEITVYSDRHEHKINAMIGLVGGKTGSFSGTHEMLLNPAVMA